jgi:hypothetical protein
MPTTNGNKPLLDLMRWEICAPLPSGSTSGTTFAKVDDIHNTVWYNVSAGNNFLYSPDSDGYARCEPMGNVSFGAGSCAEGHMVGPSGTCPSNGTSTTIVTANSLRRSLSGYKIHITGGPAAGDVRTIDTNSTTGTNCSVTVTSAFSASPTTATTYRLLTPRIYSLTGSSTASTSFRVFDLATNTVSTLANNPISGFSECNLRATHAFRYNDFVSFATGTATSATANTLSNSAKAWTTNQWTNQQVRITGGTGAGQIRTISSNTGTQLTVSANWTITPDATSTYSIEGNDDHIYVCTTAATGLYRYSISGNTWSAALTSRAAGAGAGSNILWPFECTNSDWTNENSIRNGRYLLSPRGASTANIDIYDIALNTWENSVQYVGMSGETFTTGTNWVYDRNHAYVLQDGSGRMGRIHIPDRYAEGWGTSPVTTTSSVVGNKLFIATYRDGATRINWVYSNPGSTSSLLRKMNIE